jgi:hypothetical protein
VFRKYKASVEISSGSRVYTKDSVSIRSRMMRGEETDGRVFKTVLFYCLLILVLPIATFFVSKSIVFEWFLGQVKSINHPPLVSQSINYL